MVVLAHSSEAHNTTPDSGHGHGHGHHDECLELYPEFSCFSLWNNTLYIAAVFAIIIVCTWVLEALWEAPSATINVFLSAARRYVGCKGQVTDQQLFFAKDVHALPQSLVDRRARGHAARARQALALGGLVEELDEASRTARWSRKLQASSPACRMANPFDVSSVNLA